jgi:hypothetical protein
MHPQPENQLDTVRCFVIGTQPANVRAPGMWVGITSERRMTTTMMIIMMMHRLGRTREVASNASICIFENQTEEGK